MSRKPIQEILKERPMEPFVYNDRNQRFIGKRTGKPIVLSENDSSESELKIINTIIISDVTSNSKIDISNINPEGQEDQVVKIKIEPTDNQKIEIVNSPVILDQNHKTKTQEQNIEQMRFRTTSQQMVNKKINGMEQEKEFNNNRVSSAKIHIPTQMAEEDFRKSTKIRCNGFQQLDSFNWGFSQIKKSQRHDQTDFHDLQSFLGIIKKTKKPQKTKDIRLEQIQQNQQQRQQKKTHSPENKQPNSAGFFKGSQNNNIVVKIIADQQPFIQKNIQINRREVFANNFKSDEQDLNTKQNNIQGVKNFQKHIGGNQMFPFVMKQDNQLKKQNQKDSLEKYERRSEVKSFISKDKNKDILKSRRYKDNKKNRVDSIDKQQENNKKKKVETLITIEDANVEISNGNILINTKGPVNIIKDLRARRQPPNKNASNLLQSNSQADVSEKKQIIQKSKPKQKRNKRKHSVSNSVQNKQQLKKQQPQVKKEKKKRKAKTTKKDKQKKDREEKQMRVQQQRKKEQQQKKQQQELERKKREQEERIQKVQKNSRRRKSRMGNRQSSIDNKTTARRPSNSGKSNLKKQSSKSSSTSSVKSMIRVNSPSKNVQKKNNKRGKSSSQSIKVQQNSTKKEQTKNKGKVSKKIGNRKSSQNKNQYSSKRSSVASRSDSFNRLQDQQSITSSANSSVFSNSSVYVTRRIRNRIQKAKNQSSISHKQIFANNPIQEFNDYMQKILGSNPNVTFNQSSRSSDKVVALAEMVTEGSLMKVENKRYKQIKVQTLVTTRKDLIEILDQAGNKVHRAKNCWTFYNNQNFQIIAKKKSMSNTILKITVLF